MIAIEGGTLINGDGTVAAPLGALLIQDNVVHDVMPPGERLSRDFPVATRIDATGRWVFPGIVNNHSHALSLGPLFASAARALPPEQVKANLNRHLLEGTTTAINMDGFALKDEVDRARALSPLRVELTTINTPANLRAAEFADGAGLTEAHKRSTWRAMVAAGATAIAEIGAGATLGGMGQDYLYIPRAIKQATGGSLEPLQARTLKEAVLGRYCDPAMFDAARVRAVLAEAGLADRLTAEQARDLVVGCVMPSIQAALDGIVEAAEIAREVGLPMIVHNATASKDVIARVCRRLAGGTRIVLAHSNHSTFEIEEAIEHARACRGAGAVIDITSGDYYGARRLYQSPAITFAMLGAGVVDLISTDYMSGFHDPILLILEKAVKAGLMDVPRAIAMATGNVARVFLEAASGRGLLARGKTADVVVTADRHLSHVDTVIVGGTIAVSKGTIRENSEQGGNA